MGIINKQIKTNIELLINCNKLDEAQTLIDEYLKQIINDPEAYSIKAVILIIKREFVMAEDILKHGLEYDMENFDLNYNLGYLYGKKNNYTLSYKYYKNAFHKTIDGKVKDKIYKILQNIENAYPNVLGSIKKGKIVFFDKGADKFIWDIINELSESYETRHIKVTDYKQIDEGMQWADICWFEWCDELVAYGSKHRLANMKKIICRLHSYEAFAGYVSNVKWNNVDKVIFVGDNIRKFVFDKYKINNNKTMLIPNGVNIHKYVFNERKAGFNIAYVGYINYKKGPMLLLHTFKAIYDKNHRYKLFIAGQFQDDRDVLYFKQMIVEFGIEKNVIYEGWQDNLDGWLEDKNYILCTSILESQNMSVMQAMSKGIKPLIHNFVGAKGIYPEKYIWSTINDCLRLINQMEPYSSSEYREFIETNYSLEKQVAMIKNTLEDLKYVGSNKITAVEKETAQGANTFDYAAYWNNRLNNKFDIEGVGYIGLGKIYNRYMYQMRFDILNYIVRSFFPKGLRKKQVLELGPGIGLFTDYFYKQKANYKAIDIAERSVKELKRRYKNYTFTQGDISNPTLFQSKGYDLVFSADVLLHLTDEEKYKIAIKNIARSLNATGYAVLFDPITVLNSSSLSPHVVIRDIEYIKKVCAENGLDVVDMLPCSFFMNFPFDSELFADNENAGNIFITIQKYFGSSENSGKDKEVVAQYLTTFEKLCLISFEFGLSEKVVILKKRTNKYEVKLSINEVWDIESVRKEVSIAEKQISGLIHNGDIAELDKLLQGLIETDHIKMR